MKIKAAILVVSDRVSRGVEQDRSGRAAAEALSDIADVNEMLVVPDDFDRIAKALRDWSDSGTDLILTVGGTSLGPRDVTPEATRSVLDREAPGISTALLVRGIECAPRAMLSRGTAGMRGRTLIVNLPGSPHLVRDYMRFLQAVVPQALEVISGTPEKFDE
jgi:gephyrin